MLDFLIESATVYDGLTIEPQAKSVGVRDGLIAHVGERPTNVSADRVVDAKGLALCPGFIDPHASTGLGYMLPHAGDNKLHQGITTEITGNCGTSTAPIGERLVGEMERLAEEIGFSFSWRELGEWLSQLEEHGLPFNIGTYVGHSTLRAGVVEHSQRVTEREIGSMGALLDQAMRDGALGLSTGLVYAPGSFATTGEIIDLARIVSRHGGIYVSHIRNERESLEDAIDEAIEIGERARLPVLVSHLKAAEKDNWGKIPKVIERIEQARAQGVRVTFEVYPYTATSTKLRTFIPKETLAEGASGMVEKLKTADWQRRSVAWLEQRRTRYHAMTLITESASSFAGKSGTAGKSIEQIAQAHGRPPAETVVDLLLEDPDTWIIYDCIDESDMDLALEWPHSILCSDSWSYPVNAPNSIGQPHPRTYGAFTRFLERYALCRPRMPFGQAVRKASTLAAEWLGLGGRGRIEEGCCADLVLLDLERVREKATYDQPRQFSEGTVAVWVNGAPILENGSLLDRFLGRVVTGPST